jgi:hypothetical protein
MVAGGSFSGRTTGSGPVNQGSNPCPPASNKIAQRLCDVEAALAALYKIAQRLCDVEAALAALYKIAQRFYQWSHRLAV